MQTANAASLKA